MIHPLNPCFIHAEEFPPSSTDLNPLNYFYWDFVKTTVFKGRYGKSFRIRN